MASRRLGHVGTVYWLFASVGKQMFQRLLRTEFVWKLSGISYTTAVVATKGHYISPVDYTDYCRNQTDVTLRGDLFGRSARVLEFGCGIGGNLFAISPRIREGVGLDVNRGYIRIARRLANRFGFRNLTFASYDGSTLPDLGPFDLVFSLNVFERIPKARVRRYLEWMASALAKSGTLVALFLTSDARASQFTRSLGDSAYVFWDRGEAEEAIRGVGFRVISALPMGLAHVVTGKQDLGSPNDD